MNVVKFVITWLFVTVLCMTFESYIVYIFNFFDAGLNYVFSGTIGTAIKSIIAFFGSIFDKILLTPSTSYVTATGVNVGNVVWIGTLAQIALMLFILKLFWRMVFND